MAVNEGPDEEGGDVEETESELVDLQEWIQVDSLFGVAAVAVESIKYRDDQYVVGIRSHIEIGKDDLGTTVFQLIEEGVESVGILVTAAQARQLAGAFLNAADHCDQLTMDKLKGNQ